MITSPAFRGRRYAVLGLARSGLATVEALVASGARVTAWDEREEAREAASKLRPGTGRGTATRSGVVEGSRAPASVERSGPLHQPSPSATAGPPPRSGEDLLTFADPLTIDLAGYAGVIVSPGVPLNKHPIAAYAKAAGVPVIGDIELFAQARPSLPPHKVVGITGTNGKSTTTALIHHILKTAGIPTEMGGNIGLPILAQDPLPEGGVYVLELSSYQIDLTYSLDCDVAVLLNITPDHLDRYENFEAYAASKGRLLRMQSESHCAIVSAWTQASALQAAGLDQFVASLSHRYKEDQSAWPALQGPHNLENVMAAREAAMLLGVPDDAVEEALRTYPGLPHRMERIGEKNGILFVNDSKATNPDSTAPALAAYPHVHWIVGGRAKTEDLGPCADQLGHVRAAYTIGEAGPMFARLLEGRVPVTQSGVLPAAVSDAAKAAVPGEVVLLSPACASFDQYRDYEARGEAFRAAVEALA